MLKEISKTVSAPTEYMRNSCYVQDAYSLFLIVRYNENAGEWGPQGPHNFPGAEELLKETPETVSAPADYIRNSCYEQISYLLSLIV